jgi:hypothetical protein
MRVSGIAAIEDEQDAYALIRLRFVFQHAWVVSPSFT